MNNLKKLRLERGLTQKEASEIVGVSQSTYNYYEQTEVNSSLESFLKLADFYNVSMDYLIGRDFATAKDSFDNEIMEVVSKLDITEKSRVLGYAKGRLEAQKELKDIRIRSGYRG